VLLGVVLGLQLLYSAARVRMLSLPDTVMPARDALLVGDLYPIDSITPEQSDELLARPLFWEGRRALAAEDESVSQKRDRGAGHLKDIKLQGVFGAGDASGAIIRVKGKQRRVMVGEEINGWTVESVDANEVVLSSRGRTQSLELRTGIVAARATVPVAPAKAAPAQRGSDQQPARQSAAGTAGRESAAEAGEDQLSAGGSRLR
jgi:hypothetical protein